MHVYALIYQTVGVEGLVRSCLAMKDNTRQVCLQNWTWEKHEKQVHVYNRINFAWFHRFLIWLYYTMRSVHYLISRKTFSNCCSISIHWINRQLRIVGNFAYIRKINDPFFKCMRKMFTINIYWSIYLIIYFNILGETINIDIELTLSSMEPLQFIFQNCFTLNP